MMIQRRLRSCDESCRSALQIPPGLHGTGQGFMPRKSEHLPARPRMQLPPHVKQMPGCFGIQIGFAAVLTHVSGNVPKDYHRGTPAVNDSLTNSCTFSILYLN